MRLYQILVLLKDEDETYLSQKNTSYFTHEGDTTLPWLYAARKAKEWLWLAIIKKQSRRVRWAVLKL